MNAFGPAAAFVQGVNMGQRRVEQRRRNALADLYQTQGQGIANGDQNAINALAVLDPMAAMQINRQRAADTRAERQFEMNSQLTQARLSELRESGRREAARFKAQMSAAEQAEAAAKIDMSLRRATMLYQMGDLDGLNKLLVDAGEVPIESLDQFPAYASVYEGVADGLATAKELRAGPEEPASVQALRIRAQEAGLEPGTEDYANFMANGGKIQSGERITTGPDGQVIIERGSAVNNTKPPSERQSQIRLFGGLMNETMPSINALEGKFDPTSLQSYAASGGVVGNLLTSEEAQLYESLKRQWAEGVLRLQTGAAATQPEIDRVMQTYFPQPGDTERTVRQKSIQRDVFARSLEVASGNTIDAPGGAAKRPGLGGDVPTITDDASYDALPSGAIFIDPEGNRRRKP